MANNFTYNNDSDNEDKNLDGVEDEDSINEDDAEDDEEAEAEEIEEAEELEFVQRKLVQNRFRRIKRVAPKRFFPHLTNNEKNIVNQMKQINKAEVRELNNEMAKAKEAFWGKVKTALSAIVPILPIALIILVVILVVGLIVSAIMGIFGGGGSGGGNGMSSVFGITGEQFYGARLIYENEEQSKADMLKSFAGIFGEVESAVETANGNIDITINLPTDDYDYLTLDETAFSTEYPDAYQIMFDLSSLIAENDLVEGEALGTTMSENLDLIKYFGYNSELTPEMASIISEYINTNDLYTIENSDETTDTSSYESLITSETLNVLSEEKYNIRTEKLYVKDYILEGDNTMQNIPKENYKYMIFMPKQNVTFTYFSFVFVDIDYNNFELTLQNAGSSVNFTSRQFTTEGDGGVSYLYETSLNLNVSASTFTDIDTNNLSALSEGLSVYEIVNSELNSEIYLTDLSAENIVTTDTNIKTIKVNGLNAEFNSDNAFYFMEYMTEVDW